MSIWEKILFKGQSQFNQEIKVADEQGKRRLVVNGYTQSQKLLNGAEGWMHYWDSMVPGTLSLSPDSRVLILGLGAGTVGKIITKRFGLVAIDGVEIDPLVIDLAKKYFDLDEKNINVVIADAKDFLTTCRYKYDFICLDIFVGGQVPQGFEDEDFLKRVKPLLKERGVLSINRIFHDKGKREEFENFLKQLFKLVKASDIKGNTITYASDEDL